MAMLRYHRRCRRSRERKSTGQEERVEVKVDSQYRRHRHGEPQHIAKEAMDVGMREEGRGHVGVVLIHGFRQNGCVK